MQNKEIISDCYSSNKSSMKESDNSCNLKEIEKRQSTNIIIENEEESKGKSNVPDGGWGWFVLFATVAMRTLMAGVFVSFGLFLAEMVIEFNSTQTVLSWVVALNQAMCLALTPLASLLAERFSHKFVAIIGSIFLSMSFILPYFVPKLWMIFLSGSLFNGIGQSFVYLSSTVILTTYFEKYLSIALGIYATGTGIASFSMAPLIDILIQRFGWRLTMLIYGGIMSICILFSLTFKITKSKTQKETEIQLTENQNNVTNINSQMNVNNEPKLIADNSEKAIHINLEIQENNANSSENDKSNQIIEIDLETCCINNEKSSNKQIFKEFTEILKNRIFLVFLLSNLLIFCGHDSTYIYTKDKAMEVGVSKSKSLLLMTFIGIGNVLGRLMFGYLGSIKRINVYFLYMSCVIMTGGCIIFLNFAYSYPLMIMSTCGFGIFIGGTITLNPVVVTKILHISQFSKGFAIVSFIQGFSFLVGAPLAGYIYDTTKSLTLSFTISGSFFVSGGFVLLLSLLFKNFRSNLKLC